MEVWGLANVHEANVQRMFGEVRDGLGGTAHVLAPLGGRPTHYPSLLGPLL